jgi:hypothetical protein
VKKLVSAAIFSVLVMGPAVASAAAKEADQLGAVKTSALSGPLAEIKPAIFSAGKILDMQGVNIFWVLGGGLVAVSLLARRIS